MQRITSPLGISLQSVRVLGLGTRLDFAPVLGRVIVPVAEYGREDHAVCQVEQPETVSSKISLICSVEMESEHQMRHSYLLESLEFLV